MSLVVSGAITTFVFCSAVNNAISARASSSSDLRIRNPMLGPDRTFAGLEPKKSGATMSPSLPACVAFTER